MIKAVLLDLDNTLLHNPEREWVAAFRGEWDRHFLQRYGIENASAALRGAIGCLNREPPSYLTNSAVLHDALVAELPLTEREVAAAVASFYAEAYGRLQAITSPVSMAADLVRELQEQDLLLAIATNPFFPEEATCERIGWAGLSDFVADFAFITHSENMRFAKPSPAYFAETVARVGVEPDETLLIGDSRHNDIEPANAIGIHTWQVSGALELGEALNHVRKSGWRQDYPSRQLETGMILPQYMGNIAALYGLLAEVKPHQWHQRPDEDEWSIMQILCHLWQTEAAVHRARLQTILCHADPFVAAPAPPGPDIPPCHDDAEHIMRCFRREREATIGLLAGLTAAQWQRPARHSIFGLTNLLEMAHFTAQHDRLHITQLCQTLGKCAD